MLVHSIVTMLIDCTYSNTIAYVNAEAVSAMSGLCIQHSTNSHQADPSQAQMVAASLFATTRLSSQQLDSLLCMPWQKASDAATHPASQHRTAPARSPAKIATLLIQAASISLNHPDLTSADFGSKQGSSGLLHKALQDPDSSVQAAAAAVLPVIVANTAEAAKGSARGQPTVGIRLLQKGLDCLLGFLHHEAAQTGPVKTAVAFAVSGCVSMQAIVEHRPFALCKAAQGLLLIQQNKSSGSRVSSTASEGGSANLDGISSLDCWPVDRRNYHELPVTGHIGAAVPLKALKAFTDALLFSKQPEVMQGSHQGLHKVSTAICASPGRASRHTAIMCVDPRQAEQCNAYTSDAY